MLTIDEAFKKFKSRLELSSGEQEDASRRQKRIREIIDDAFNVKRDFLTGSYARNTKTKPLKDVDIFIVLNDNEGTYREKTPGTILEEVRIPLANAYGDPRVATQRRSVRVDFGVTLVDDLTSAVMSFDVTPAVESGDHYEIPDRDTWDWMATNPLIHANLATQANADFSGEWKPVVKMIKKWNEHQGKPITPSFLIEVMSLDLLTDWGGSYPRELKAWFATAMDAIDETWEDPAHLGHPVSDKMSADAGLRAAARLALKQAEAACTEAMTHDRQGRTAGALGIWQDMFGPAFAKS